MVFYSVFKNDVLRKQLVKNFNKNIRRDYECKPGLFLFLYSKGVVQYTSIVELWFYVFEGLELSITEKENTTFS